MIDIYSASFVSVTRCGRYMTNSAFKLSANCVLNSANIVRQNYSSKFDKLCSRILSILRRFHPFHVGFTTSITVPPIRRCFRYFDHGFINTGRLCRCDGSFWAHSIVNLKFDEPLGFIIKRGVHYCVLLLIW